MTARVFIDTPVVCGHRGCGAGVVRGHRENTLGSFRAAVDAGVRWVEVDARITAEDVLVAHHDPVADGGHFVADLPAEATDALGIMRLSELLEDLPPGVGVDIDVKSSLEDALRPRDRTTAALTADLVAAEVARRPVLVTSFDPAAPLIARERAPGVATGLLTWGRFPLRKAIAAAAQLGLEVVAPHVSAFPLGSRPDPPVERALATCVRVAHEAGLQLLAWGPDPAETAELIEAGVDCVCVDDAPAALAQRSVPVPRP